MPIESLKEYNVAILCVLDPSWIDEYEAADESRRLVLEMAPRFIQSPKCKYAVGTRYLRDKLLVSLYYCPVDELYPEWPYPKPETVE